MPQTLVTIHNPISFLVQSTVQASFALLTANFTTGVVTSTLLSPRACDLLTERVQSLKSAGNISEAAFPGAVNALLSATLLETGTLVQSASYAAPNATLTLSGVTNPATIAITIPFSTSAGIVGAP